MIDYKEQNKAAADERLRQRIIKMNAQAYKYKLRHTPARKAKAQDFEISFEGLKGK